MNHIEDERLLQFASEVIDLSLDENIHFDNCSKCWRRLIEAIEFVVLMRTEEVVGTTRSRITHFMNKFRKMGLIDYNGELTIRTELLTDLLLHD